MMDKKSNEGIPCVVCGRPSIQGTIPAVCSEHKGLRKEASIDDSLDAITQNPDIWTTEKYA